MLLNSLGGSVGYMFAVAQTTKKDIKWQTAGNGNSAKAVSLKEHSAGILRSNTCSLIAGRLSAGKILNAAEKRYLRENDPEMYRRATMLEAERKLYRRRLKMARTKDEVRKLNMSASAHMVSEAGAAGSSSGGSSRVTTDSLETTSMRASAIRNEHGAFVNTREYRKLPENMHELKRRKKAPAASGSRAIAAPPIRSAVLLTGTGIGYGKRGISYLV